jgi:hypothetical protein
VLRPAKVTKKAARILSGLPMTKQYAPQSPPAVANIHHWPTWDMQRANMIQRG